MSGPRGQGSRDPSSPATRILDAWIQLESTLRKALPECSVRPPTQPSELLAALLINQVIGSEEETRVLALREIRNRVAHAPDEPAPEEAALFEEEVEAIQELVASAPSPLELYSNEG